MSLSRAGATDALTVDRIARARGVRERLAIVLRKLVPPPTFMRKWSPLGLAAAYVWRPLRVTARLPAALRNWHRAKRARG